MSNTSKFSSIFFLAAALRSTIFRLRRSWFLIFIEAEMSLLSMVIVVMPSIAVKEKLPLASVFVFGIFIFWKVPSFRISAPNVALASPFPVSSTTTPLYSTFFSWRGVVVGVVGSEVSAATGCSVSPVCPVFSSTACITSLAKSFVVRATASMLLIIISRAASGRNIRYLVLPISFVLFLFIIVIRFLSGKTLKLL